jgi:cleavage stimulation factor subunit 1
VRVLEAAHDGAPVLGCEYSPSGNFLLTTGADSTVRLFDLSTYKQVQIYRGVHTVVAPHSATTAAGVRIKASFDHSGSFVLCGDAGLPGFAAWDARTGELVRRIDAHTGVVGAIVASPVDAAFVTCGQDHRTKFWSV